MRSDSLFRATVMQLIASCLLSLAGCAEKNADMRGSVRGLVTFEGKPVAKGSIAFEPTAGTRGPSAGGDIIEGRYQIATPVGPAIGTHVVRVSALGQTGRKVLNAVNRLVDELVETVPDRYNTASTLQVEIKKGRNELNLDLHSKPE